MSDESSPERRVTRQGIHIDREVADSVAIEEELDSNITGPYQFPDPVRRLVPALIYLAAAVVVAITVSPVPALLLVGLGIWHVVSAFSLDVDQEQAMIGAASAVPFSVGHASAAITFHGLRARPRWSVILYSATEPPDQRALVVLDARTGQRLGEPFIENIAAL